MLLDIMTNLLENIIFVYCSAIDFTEYPYHHFFPSDTYIDRTALILVFFHMDEDLEHLGAPHPYTNNSFKKIPRNLKKKSGIWGYQMWVPELLLCEIS